MQNPYRARAGLIGAMLIFGTIGIFRRALPLPSGMLAMARGLGGALFLLIFLCLRRQRLQRTAIAANLPVLLLSGAAIGINWILLFEAYAYTSVATATLCYYMAPIFVLLAAPVVLRERLTLRKAACILLALIGMIPVSGLLRTGGVEVREIRGVLLGLGAALFYASVVLLNGRLRDISAYDRTVVQLAAAGLVLLPYSLLREDWASVSFDASVVGVLAVVCILHTGIAYALYFWSMQQLPAQTVALYGYIDPIAAILLSACLLHEPMGLPEIIGAVLILSATVFSEFPASPKKTGREG